MLKGLFFSGTSSIVCSIMGLINLVFFFILLPYTLKLRSTYKLWVSANYEAHINGYSTGDTGLEYSLNKYKDRYCVVGVLNLLFLLGSLTCFGASYFCGV